MDKIEELAKQASNLTFYDVKSYYNQARNAILNVSPMEAKVREATDPDEPWGASSTLMQEIAQATHNFQHFNEILPLIWSRFHESEARQWRQIYKALTLLEYLVKNGSERVVDDARGHISTVKMLRSFHYTDEKGKDQGINVRNRAKEIAELLSDVEKIRIERRRAKANKNKYGGTGSEGSGGGFGGSGSRYGGFGSQETGRYRGSSDQNGAGSGYDSGRRPDYDSGDVYRSNDSRAEPEYDEYDAGDDDDRSNKMSSSKLPSRSKPSSSAAVARPSDQPQANKPTVVQDLFDFGDEAEQIQTSVALPRPTAPGPMPSTLDDDDFADFQGATIPSAQPVKPSPSLSSAPAQDVFSLLNAPRSQNNHQKTPSPAIPANPTLSKGMGQGASSSSGPSVPQPSGGGFDDLWTTSLAGVGGSTGQISGSNSKKSMLDLDREKTMNSLWNAPASSPAYGSTPTGSGARTGGSTKNAFDDLLG